MASPLKRTSSLEAGPSPKKRGIDPSLVEAAILRLVPDVFFNILQAFKLLELLQLELVCKDFRFRLLTPSWKKLAGPLLHFQLKDPENPESSRLQCLAFKALCMAHKIYLNHSQASYDSFLRRAQHIFEPFVYLKAIDLISSKGSAERGKARPKRSGLNEEAMALAMADEEDRSGKAAAGRTLDEIKSVAYLNTQEPTPPTQSGDLTFHALSHYMQDPRKFAPQDLIDELRRRGRAFSFYLMKLFRKPFQELYLIASEEAKRMDTRGLARYYKKVRVINEAFPSLSAAGVDLDAILPSHYFANRAFDLLEQERTKGKEGRDMEQVELNYKKAIQKAKPKLKWLAPDPRADCNFEGEYNIKDNPKKLKHLCKRLFDLDNPRAYPGKEYIPALIVYLSNTGWLPSLKCCHHDVYKKNFYYDGWFPYAVPGEANPKCKALIPDWIDHYDPAMAMEEFFEGEDKPLWKLVGRTLLNEGDGLFPDDLDATYDFLIANHRDQLPSWLWKRIIEQKPHYKPLAFQTLAGGNIDRAPYWLIDQLSVLQSSGVGPMPHSLPVPQAFH